MMPRGGRVSAFEKKYGLPPEALRSKEARVMPEAKQNERLLTPKEISKCYDISENDIQIATVKEWATARKAVDVEISKAQNAKTLKEVGEWLVNFLTKLNVPVMHGDYQFDVIETNKLIEALKQGKMPEDN